MQRYLAVAVAMILILVCCKYSLDRRSSTLVCPSVAFPPEAPESSVEVEVENLVSDVSLLEIYKIWQEEGYVHAKGKIRNSGPQAVDACLLGVELPESCHCVWVVKESTTLKPGQSRIIHMYFSDNLDAGPERRFYTLWAHRKGEPWSFD